MSAEALSVADDMLHAFFERWHRLECAKAEVSDDLKELFSEMKGVGFDTKAARAVFREQIGDKTAKDEFDAICDLYRASLERPRAHPAPARVEKIEKFPPAPERKAAGSAPREMGGEGANTGGKDVDRSASARPSGQTLGAEPHSIESGIADFENIERNTSGPDAKRAPHSETRAASQFPGAAPAGGLSADALAAGPSIHEQPETANQAPMVVYGDSAEATAFQASLSKFHPAGNSEAKRDGVTLSPADTFSPSPPTPSPAAKLEPAPPLAGSSTISKNAQKALNNDEPSLEAGPQAQASQCQDTGVRTLAGREGRFEGEAASADLPTFSPSAALPPQPIAPEPPPQVTQGSGAPIPDELIVPHIRKDHEPPTSWMEKRKAREEVDA